MRVIKVDHMGTNSRYNFRHVEMLILRLLNKLKIKDHYQQEIKI